MMMTRRALLTAMVLTIPGLSLAQAPADEYTPSDPARVGGTGRPQLVEFFHPL
jgi:hypothetical protein